MLDKKHNKGIMLLYLMAVHPDMDIGHRYGYNILYVTTVGTNTVNWLTTSKYQPTEKLSKIIKRPPVPKLV